MLLRREHLRRAPGPLEEPALAVHDREDALRRLEDPREGRRAGEPGLEVLAQPVGGAELPRTSDENDP